MLDTLIRLALKQRALVLAMALVLLVVGAYRATQLPVEVLPDLTKPTVTLLTESPGLSPEEVETLVSIPLENSLMGVTGVTRLRTVNDIGLSLIFIEFDWGTDIYKARQFVQERLAGVAEILPEGVSPYMTPVASLMGNIMLIGVVDTKEQMEAMELRALADWNIARRIQAIPGIAEVLSMGGGVKQLHIQPDPQRMLAYDLEYADVRNAAANAVKNTTGGFLTESAQEVMVRHLAMTTDLGLIANTVVSYQGMKAITLEDVADIRWDIEPMRGDAGMGSKLLHEENEPVRGFPGIVISVTKSPGFDTIALGEKVEAVLEDLQATMPDGVRILTIYNQSEFIHLAIDNLTEALRDGAIMVALVLFLFLMNVRITLITLSAIPLSMAMTILVFDFFQMSVNSMTLGGLAVAIGMVVDDAIVDVENVFRRLRENAKRREPKPKLQIIAAASAEIRSSILYATLLIILVFIPLLALSGVEGRLFSPIAIATMVSMAASFIISLTVIPVLSFYLLNPKPKEVQGDGRLVTWLKAFFLKTWLRFSLANPPFVAGLILVLAVLAYLSYRDMGGNFLPSFREPSVVVATTTAPGTSLKYTTELAKVAQDRLLQIPEVETVGYRVGRAERGDHVVPVSTVEFDVELSEAPERSHHEVLEAIRTEMKGIPGTFSAIGGPLADRIGHMLSGVSAKVAVKVYGSDLDKLRDIGQQIVTIAREIPGLEEARGEQQAPIPQLRFEVNRQKAMAYGITPGAVNEQLAALMGGEVVADVYEGQRSYDVVVRLPLEWRESPDRLRQLYFKGIDGRQVPLHAIAAIREAKGPNNILRENTLRRFVVSINPTVSDLNQVVEELQHEVANRVNLPEGYSIAYEGEYQAQQEASRIILLMSVLVLIVVLFLLYGYFKSFTLVALVCINLPISIIGGVFLTAWSLDNISIATLVGFIAISGIAARNNIMMVSHYLHLMRHEGESFTQGMVERGTLERLVPILMTALSAGIALIPIVIAAGESGKEILNPIAIVIVGGLVSSTLLGLGVTPSFFLRYCKRAAAKSIERGSAASN